MKKQIIISTIISSSLFSMGASVVAVIQDNRVADYTYENEVDGGSPVIPPDSVVMVPGLFLQ